MKKVLSMILVIVMLAAFAGCQATPEKPLVTGKNVDNLIQKATETDETVITSPEPAGPDNRAILMEKLDIPERFIAQNSYSDGRLTYTADADISLPDAAALPVMRVEPADFSQELVDKLYGYLVGDTLMYQQQQQYTKAQVEEDLVMWRQILNDPGSAAESKAQAEEKIAELEEGYGSAADSPELVPADAAIGIQQEIDIQTGKVRAEYSGVDLAEVPGVRVQRGKTFLVRNNTKDGVIIKEENVGGFTVTDTASQGARFYYTDYDLSPTPGDASCYVDAETVTPDSLTERPDKINGFTYQNALDMAQGFLDAAGIEDMKVSSLTLILVLPDSYNDVLFDGNAKLTDHETAMLDVRNGKYDNEAKDVRYKLELVRSVSGVQVTSDGLSSYIDDAYGKQWYYERFTIDVCSKGISGVSWISPYTIVETVAGDANMLAFNEIAGIFDNMFRATYDTSGANNEGKVTRVTLTLRRVMEQNNIFSGLLVPVWDFYGSLTVSYPDYPEEPPMEMVSDKSLLTINGIDGTVIDVDKGY